MKQYLFSLVVLFLLSSCQEDEVKPKADPFVGNWHLSSPETPIEISFQVVKEGAVHNIINRSVIHPAIPAIEQDNNQLKTYDRFENGNGFGRIEITSRGTVYYKVTLIYSRFTEEGMAVYDVQIDIPSEPFMVLTDQVFTKLD